MAILPHQRGPFLTLFLPVFGNFEGVLGEIREGFRVIFGSKVEGNFIWREVKLAHSEFFMEEKWRENVGLGGILRGGVEGNSLKIWERRGKVEESGGEGERGRGQPELLDTIRFCVAYACEIGFFKCKVSFTFLHNYAFLCIFMHFSSRILIQYLPKSKAYFTLFPLFLPHFFFSLHFSLGI